MSEKTFHCYNCGTELEMHGNKGWCPLEQFWDDRPGEPRFEDGLLPEELR